METVQFHVQKGLLTKQIMKTSKVTEMSKVELPKVELNLDEVNNPVSIKGHLLKGLVIQKS